MNHRINNNLFIFETLLKLSPNFCSIELLSYRHSSILIYNISNVKIHNYKVMLTMSKIRDFIDKALASVTIFVFGILIVCVVWQVISRFVLGSPSTVTDELARFMFIWVGLLGAAYTLGQRRHLAIDLLTGALTGKKKQLSDVLIIVAIASFAGLILVNGGMQLVAKTLSTGQVSPALRFPMGYVYAAIPFSGALMLFYCFDFLVGVLSGNGLGPNDQSE